MITCINFVSDLLNNAYTKSTILNNLNSKQNTPLQHIDYIMSHKSKAFLKELLQIFDVVVKRDNIKSPSPH